MLIEEIENLKLENERLKADVHLRDEWNKLFMGIIESLHLWLMGTNELCMDSVWIARKGLEIETSNEPF